MHYNALKLTLLLASSAALFFATSAQAENFYVAQAAIGTASGTDAANAKAVTFFNTSGNWSSPTKVAGKIGPGDTVHLVGTITTALAVQASGTAGNIITILFDPGAKMSSPAWPNSGAIWLGNKSYITIDGGATGSIGGSNGSAAYVNGIIENTDNGTTLGQKINSTGVKAIEGKFFTIKNLAIYNMYVRTRGTEQNAYGTAISNTDSNGNGINNFRVTNCLIHDAYVGIDSDYGPNDNTYEFSFVTAYNCNWGGRCGDRGSTSTMTGLLVHDNYFYNFTNWDDTLTNNFHHNGFYAWAQSGGTLYTYSAYNNKIGPNFSIVNAGEASQANHSTSGLFVSGKVIGPILIYNNLFIDNVGTGPSNGLITFGTSIAATLRIYNNTFIGGTGAQSISFSNGGSGILTVFVQNNLFYGGDVAISCLYNTNVALTSNRNLGYGLVSGPFKWASSGSGGGMSLTSWESATGQDTDFISSDPLLDTTFKAKAGSPAIAAAANLGTFFSFDKDNLPRTAIGNWDIGAYATATLGAPSNARVLVSTP